MKFDRIVQRELFTNLHFGNRYFRCKDYARAAKNYREALESIESNSVLGRSILFNLELTEKKMAVLKFDRSLVSNGSVRQARKETINRLYSDFDESTAIGFTKRMKEAYLRSPDCAQTFVSIVMPTFNRADIIATAIDSVLAQSHRQYELIIVDDGSTDETSKVLDNYRKRMPLHLLRLDHVGVSAARNAGLRNASGKYIAYLDSDNCWTPDFLLCMVAFLESCSLEAGYAAIRLYDDTGRVVGHRGDVFVWAECLRQNYIDLNAFVHLRDLPFRHEVPELFDSRLLRLVDWDFILRNTAYARVAYAPFVGVDYYDGDSGSRITKTVYQDGYIDKIMTSVRGKHEACEHSCTTVDTGDGLRLGMLRKKRITLPESDAYPPLFFYPDYRSSNPYQTLLYRALGHYMAEPGTLDDALACALRCRSNNGRVVFHLHWLNPLLVRAQTEGEAKVIVDAVISRLQLFTAVGGLLVWTVHNVISHEPRFLTEEIRLSRAVAEHADVIHIHHPEVADATSGLYTLPQATVLVAQHGNYIGSLPDSVDREEARARLNIPSDAVVFLFLGQIRGYKGIDDLLVAYATITENHPRAWLVIAGKVLGVDSKPLGERLGCFPRARFYPGYVPDDQMSVFLRAADVMVLPYYRVLTSGTVFLAMSFGLPVICPEIGLLRYLVTDAFNGLTYDAEHSSGLLDTMNRFMGSEASFIARLGMRASETAKANPWEKTAALLRLRLASLDFGEPVRVDLPQASRTWYVRGNLEDLRGRRCIAIVVHYSNVNDTIACLETLDDQGPDVGILLISNTEDISDLAELHHRFPGVVAAQSESNIGYAAANNFGLWIAREFESSFFWLVNPDILLPGDAYIRFKGAAQDWPECNFFGSTLVSAEHPETVLFCGGAVEYDRGAAPSHLWMGRNVRELPYAPFECDYLTGANVFGRTVELPEIGYLPEQYFLYFEETHWFVQYVRSRGGAKPLVIPDLIVSNRKRSEGDGLPARHYLYYFCRNALAFGARFSQGAQVNVELQVRRFSDAWLEKIARRSPERHAEFERIVERAFSDHHDGILGRVDLEADES